MRIHEHRGWRPEEILKLCRIHGWYTLGSNSEYSDLLDYVKRTVDPTEKDILTVASNIVSHSEQIRCISVAAVASSIANNAITIYYMEDEI